MRDQNLHADAEPAQLIDAVLNMLTSDRRVLLGIVGAPGAGKSTFAAALVEEARKQGVDAAAVPMDGFHFPSDRLRQLGMIDRRGAIETFDAAGVVTLVRRLRRTVDEPIVAPGFDRSVEEPVPGLIRVASGTRLVVVEGNYLLDNAPPWNELRELFTCTWFLDIDNRLRRDRLLARHVHFGRSVEAAREWMAHVDDPNAERITSSRHRADLIVRLPEHDQR